VQAWSQEEGLFNSLLVLGGHHGPLRSSSTMKAMHDRLRGAMVGAVYGDALGAEREGAGFAATDATQQMLFVSDGLIRSFLRQRASGTSDADALSAAHQALRRWLDTQAATEPPPVRTVCWSGPR
jgi:ADP-ribosylglycohydrolase